MGGVDSVSNDLKKIATSSVESSKTQEKLPKNAQIAIVGGSLVGPLAELFLRSQGFTDITTFEAAPSSRSQAGGTIGIDESVFPILATVGITPSEVEAYPNGVSIWDITEGSPVPIKKNTKYGGVNTTWDIFHHALAQRVNIQHGKRVVGLSPEEGKAQLLFKDGARCKADLVIFADGRGSVGRKLLDSSREMEYQGYAVWRGLASIPHSKYEGFTFFTHSKRNLLYALSAPIQKGVSKGLSDWAFYQGIPADTFRSLSGRSPHEHAYFFPNQISVELRAHLNETVESCIPKDLARIIVGTDQVSLVPINDIVAPSQSVWSIGSSKAVLIGDALMPVRPHTARGLNNGIEQAFQMVQRISDDPFSEACAMWQEATIQPLEQWRVLGKQLAHMYNLGMPVPRDIVQ